MSVYGNFIAEKSNDILSYFLNDNNIADYSDLYISECNVMVLPELAFAECSMNYLFESYLEENNIALNEKIDMKAVGSKIKQSVINFLKKLKEMIMKVIEKIKEIGKKVAFTVKDFNLKSQYKSLLSEFDKLIGKVKDSDKKEEFKDKLYYYYTKMDFYFIPHFDKYSSNIKIEEWMNKYSQNMKGSYYSSNNPSEENIDEKQIKKDIIDSIKILNIFDNCHDINIPLDNGDFEKANERIRNYKEYLFSEDERKYFVYDQNILTFISAAENSVRVGVKFIKSYISQLETYNSWVDKNLEIAERFDNGTETLDDKFKNIGATFNSSNLKIGSTVIKSSITLLSSTSWFLMSWANDALNEAKRIIAHSNKVNKEIKEYLKTEK